MQDFNIFDAFVKNTKANVSLMMAAGLSALGLAVGVAVDTARLTSHDLKLQHALDASTLYVASLGVDTEEDFNAEAQKFLNENVSALNLKNLESNFKVRFGQIQGTANADLDLFFRGFLGKDKSGIGAITVVRIPTDAPCLAALNKTQNGALRLNSGASVQTNGCDLQIHSTSSDAAIINSGSSIDSSRTCVAGNIHVNAGGSTGNIETNCTPDPDPLEGVFPEPESTACQFNSRIYESSVTNLTPGVYCGKHTFQGGGFEVNMAPGTYVIKNGDWISNGGKWNGQGVTFYFADESNLQFNSGVEVSFKAPSAGDYARALMTEAPNLSQSQMVLNDSNGFDFDGIIYLPSRDLTLNSGGNVVADNVSVIADTIIINNLKIISADEGNDIQTVYIAE